MVEDVSGGKVVWLVHLVDMARTSKFVFTFCRMCSNVGLIIIIMLLIFIIITCNVF